jgi:sterol 3beta-glucosyltransferase
MRIALLCVGSRGDVQPYIALGRGLQDAGHAVRLATHAEFGPFVQEHGLEFALLEGNPRAVLESNTGQAWQKSSSNPLQYLQNLRRVAAPLLRQLLVDCRAASHDADVILYSVLAVFPALSVAEKHQIPAVAAYLQPDTLTRAFPNYRFPPPPARLGPGRALYNQATYGLMRQLYWLFLRDLINQAREAALRLPALPRWAPRSRGLHLYGYSRYVLPKPRDWSAREQVTGYWVLAERQGWTPPPALVEFLAADPPPVYVGFGSMNNRDPQAVTEMVLDALTRTGQRGVLATGWGGLRAQDLPDTVCPIGDVPHEWLFPRVAAVVHHGGSGTTAAGLRAGVPSVITPFFSDQPLWGRRVAALGAGPTPIPHKHLTAERLAAAIQQAVHDPAMRARAATLGAQIRSEDGVGHAVTALERYLGHDRRRVFGYNTAAGSVPSSRSQAGP